MRVLAHWRRSKWLSVVWAQSTSSSDVLLGILLFKTLGDNLAKLWSVMRFRGLLIFYLEISVSAIEVDLPWDIATKWCRHHLLFQYNFWLMMMKFSGDFSSLRLDRSLKMPSTTFPCVIIFLTLHSAQKESKLQIIRRWLWCDVLSSTFCRSDRKFKL